MSNRLANERSPYLLQHANNPVDWYPWGDDAFAKARTEQKPIFLSIGYSTCHWCHVMEHESFEDASIADVLNRKFVAVKVDREERPDVDRVYMTFVQATTGAGGWPMSVWLTPELRRFSAAPTSRRRHAGAAWIHRRARRDRARVEGRAREGDAVRGDHSRPPEGGDHWRRAGSRTPVAGTGRRGPGRGVCPAIR